MTNERVLRVLSLGAGVQSSTVALMCERGELPPVDAAIFADVGDEPASVYTWLDWLETQLSFPVHRVSAGNLTEATFRVRVSRKNGKQYGKNFIPSFGLDPDGSKSMLPRKCTTDFKLGPIHKQLRKMAKPPRRLKKGQQHEVLVESVIGISYDEAHRMKSPWFPWIRNVYPLVKLEMTRWHCLQWMRQKGYPEPPRSACVYCPFHSDKEWIRLKTQEPEEFGKAVQFERRLWETAAARNITTREFLHNDRVPLDQVEFKEDRNLNLFGNECEGMCGV